MILVLHILTALTSLLYTGYLFFRPSHSGLKLSTALMAATIASGTCLVVLSGAQLMQSCMTGLAYLAITTAGTLAARYRLAQKSDR